MIRRFFPSGSRRCLPLLSSTPLYPALRSSRGASSATSPSGSTSNSNEAPKGKEAITPTANPAVEEGVFLPTKAFEETMVPQMRQKYGEATYDLYRALYKELCDELRREVNLKPPAPLFGWRAWHKPHDKYVQFSRSPAPGVKCFAWSKVALTDLPDKDPTEVFLNHFEVNCCVVRDGYVAHAILHLIEDRTVLRNVAIYRDEEGTTANGTSSANPPQPPSDSLGLGSLSGIHANFVRDKLRYTGPWMGHLEEDVRGELLSFFHDYGFNAMFVKYASFWVFYLEHVESVRWLRTMQEAVLPGGVEAEEEVLSLEERTELDTPAEEWLPAASV